MPKSVPLNKEYFLKKLQQLLLLREYLFENKDFQLRNQSDARELAEEALGTRIKENVGAAELLNYIGGFGGIDGFLKQQIWELSPTFCVILFSKL